MTLVREMRVSAAARIIEITDHRLWRVIYHYVAKALTQFDLSSVKAIGLDETASRRGHNYVTVFIDMEKRQEPIIFVTPSKGKDTLKKFTTFLGSHQGQSNQILEVVCDMSLAFPSGIAEQLPNAEVTVDWLHVVQIFTRALDDVRKSESHVASLPKHLRWAVQINGNTGRMTANQLYALADLLKQGFDTATAWQIKERLKWIREAKTPQASRWRITRFVNYAKEMIGDSELLEPVAKALETSRKHAERILRRWTSTYTNARMEGLNSIFQAAKSPARGYRDPNTFMTMIYMLTSPARSILKST